jgi:hypothetical protein
MGTVTTRIAIVLVGLLLAVGAIVVGKHAVRPRSPARTGADHVQADPAAAAAAAASVHTTALPSAHPVASVPPVQFPAHPGQGVQQEMAAEGNDPERFYDVIDATLAERAQTATAQATYDAKKAQDDRDLAAGKITPAEEKAHATARYAEFQRSLEQIYGHDRHAMLERMNSDWLGEYLDRASRRAGKESPTGTFRFRSHQ